MTTKLLLATLAAATLAGCMTPSFPPDRYPQTGRPPVQTARHECGVNEVKTYRPSSDREVKDYTSTIPPSHDDREQVPNYCKDSN